MNVSRQALALFCVLASGSGCGGAAAPPRPGAPPAPERPAPVAASAPRPAYVVPARCARERHPLSCLLSDGLPLAEKGATVDPTRAMTDAVKVQNRRCAENDQDACARAASLLLVFNELSSKENATEKAATAKKGIAILRTACELGQSPLGCYVLATLTREGQLVAKDASRAAGYFARACEAALPAACYEAAEMQRDADYPNADAAEAFRLMARGCELGNAFACTMEGFAFAGGRGANVDRAKAAALFTRSCDGGDPDGCAGLGVLLVQGDGIARDVARGSALVRAACAKASAWACMQVPDLAALAE
jgi:uncharacterized protein